MITVVFSSHLGKFQDDSFKAHIKKTSGVKEIEIVCVENYGDKSLSSIYNEWLNKAKYDRILFVHNDVEFLTPKWGNILISHLRQYDIIGVAGSHSLFKEQKGCWWTHKLGGLNGNMLGKVWHTNGTNKYLSKYNESDKDVDDALLVDGVFIGVNRERLVTGFLEYSNFHFYDIPFCIENHLEGLKIGITQKIEILHKSVGKVNKEWENARVKFFNDFPNDYSILPIYSPKYIKMDYEESLPISVIIPFSKSREEFFKENVLPSIIKNKPSEIIIVLEDGTAPMKRNYGFEKSTQPYVFFCDDDIVLPENHFEKLLKGFVSDDIAYTYTGYEGIVVHKESHPMKGDFTIKSGEFDWETLKKGNYISTMALLKREYFLGFDDRLKRLQDWDLWVGLYKRFNKIGKFIDSPFKAYYLDEGITNNKNSMSDSVGFIKRKYGI